MASAVEVPVVVKRGTLSRSIEAEAMTAARTLGRSGSRAVQPLGQMLGKIRSNADEFTKSIEASNARVIAFGASVAVINGMSRAFRELVSTTIRVEKTLADINVVLNTTQKGIEKFGDGIFKVAKNTAQSFDVAAEAALEFSRQGLSTEETLKRVNDALILTRLTGLKASESVKGLTAAVNGFGKAGLTTTQIINKLSAVDVQFAVGTDDLINALSRAGAVAQDAGVSFDELVAMVTVAQQRTARGGAVIGNAFKTIYTRLQDPKALNALREVRIAVDDVSGAALPANQVLKGLADSYDNLTRTQKATIDQFVAGKFQINILKAALGDLGKANSDYSRAQLVSANATDQAIVKNKQLNQTAAALTAQTGVAIEQLVKKIGDISIGPGIKNLLTTVNSLIESMTKGLEGESIGATFAKNLLKGIGGVLTGPGLIVVGGVFIKLFKDLVVFGTRSLKNLLGLNNAAKQQAAIQEGISQLLAKNVAFQTQMAAASGNVARQQAITNRFLAEEVALRTRSASMGASLAAGAYAGGFRVSGGGDLTRRRGLRGRIPGFAPRPGTQIPGLKRRTDQMVPLTSASALGVAEGGIQRGMYDITASAGQIAKHGFGFSRRRDQLGTNNAPAVILQDMQKGGTPLGGGMQGPSAPHPGFSMKTRVHGTSSEAAVVSDIASYLNQASTRDLFRSRQVKNAEGQKVNITDDQIDSVIAAHRGAQNLASLDGRLREVDAGVRGHYQQIMADKVIEQSTARNLETALTRVGGTNVRLQGGRQGADTPIDAMMGMFPLELKKRITGSNTGPTSAASMIAKHITSTTQPQFRRELHSHAAKMDPPMTQALDDYIQNMHENFYRAYHEIASKNKLFNQKQAGSLFSQHSSKMSPEDMANAVRQYHGIMNFAPNFSPLSDAIAREKKQVGSMLGISPSDVRTRVVQNNVLRSPFNPQGFGVISPTVGQNNFADAARMHRGEDLKTANLPNFKPLRSGTGSIDPGAAPVKPFSLVPMSVKVVEEAPKVIKDRMSAAEAVRRTTAATTPRPGGAVISIPDSSLTPSGPASRTRMQRFTGAMGTATRGIGAGLRGLGGPAMTAAFMYPMVEPYLPQGADAMARFGMTGDQRVASMRSRRQATGAAIGGFGAGAMASSALTALAAANTFNPALPLRLGIMGLTAVGGAYLGSEVAPGIGEKFLGDAELSADDYGNISQQFADRARGDQDSLSAYERAYSQFLAADTSAAKGSKAKELMKIISGVNDPQLRTELTNVLQSNQTTAKQDPDSVRNQFSKIRRESADRGMSGAFYARTQQIRTRAAGRADGPKLGTMTVKEKQDLESTLVAMSDEDFAALQAVVMHGTGPGGETQSEYSARTNVRGQTVANAERHAKFREAMTKMNKKRDILIDDFARRTGATREELFGLNTGVAGVKDVFRGAADVRGNIQEVGTKAGGKGFAEGKDLYDNFLRQLSTRQRSLRLGGIRSGQAMDIGQQLMRDELGLSQRFGYTGTTIARAQARMAKDQIDSQLFIDQRALRADSLSQLPGLTSGFGKFAGGAEASQFLQRLVERGDVDSLRQFATAARTGPQETATLAGRFADRFGMGKDKGQIVKGLGQADTKGLADFFNQIADKDEDFSAAAKGAREFQDVLLDLAKNTEKNGVLYAGIEAFRGELGNALHDISMNAKSGKEALQDFGLALVSAINREVMDNLASSITEGIFGRFFGTSFFGAGKGKGELVMEQKGGIIKARNGMYISGNRTGDKNPALLEDGEYVLNREMVKAVGKENLDTMNYGVFPRFGGSKSNVMMAQSGGLSLSDAYRPSFGLLGGLGDMSQYSLKPFEMETGMLTSPGLAYKPLATPSDIMELPPLPLPSIASMEAGRANPSNLKIRGTEKRTGQGRKVFMTETGIGGGLKMYTFQKIAGQWREVGPGGMLSHNSGLKIWNFSVKNGIPTGLRYNRGTSAESRAGFPGFSPTNAISLKGQIGKTLVPGFDEGGFFSGVSMKDRRAAEKEIGVAIDSSAYNVDGTGFMLANDPQMQRMMGFFQKRQQERFNKQYASQQKKDAMVQGLVGTAIGFALNAGVDALGNKIGEMKDIAAFKKAYPGQSDSFYRSMLKSGYVVPHNQSGGYIDNIPAMLTGGEFVVNKNATQHYGTSYLNKINRMQDGGLVGGTGFEQGSGDVGAASSAPTTNHNNVGITVNFGADANPEVKTVQDGAAQDPQQFASKIRAAVMDVISQEQRVGGRLRSQKKGRR